MIQPGIAQGSMFVPATRPPGGSTRNASAGEAPLVAHVRIGELIGRVVERVRRERQRFGVAANPPDARLARSRDSQHPGRSIHADERHVLEAPAIGRELLARAAADVERAHLRGVLAAFGDERHEPPVARMLAPRLVVEVRDGVS
jgi:hypothetical protein